MNYFNSSKRLAARTLVLPAFFVLLFSAQNLFAQSSPSVRREQLLNGLNVLLLPHSGEAKFLLKLQIKSGAAFDLAGKEGTMALLGDTLVPDQNAREDIAESMDGSIDVSTTYDAINLTITGRETDFERYVELLRNVLINTPLAVENVDKLRAARVNLLRQTSVSPAVMADRAVAARLYGTYPYGRPAAGTPEALARVTRSDLLLARDRFLTADNSTLLLASNLDSRRV
ncbi:MAG TPA: insulinase family protein, partial [Pyrinomonadaceae bacterium]|nr:insulinase family protein [Pyrinomonadaceae bacterium]